MDKELSIIIPVYNGASSLRAVVEAVRATLNGIDHEIMLVNDGSKDNSEAIAQDLCGQYPEVRLISLRKNFGEHNAVMCGLNHCHGRYAAIMDDDGQNPPTELLKLYQKVREGYDVVYGQYDRKQHGFFRNLGSSWNSRLATWLLDKPKDLNLCSFKIIHRDLVDHIIQYKGPFPYVDGLLWRATANIGTVSVSHATRQGGQSNYTFRKLVRLFLNMFLNFSLLPLRLFTFTGLFVFLAGFLLSAWFVIDKLFFHPNIDPGWTSLIVVIMTLAGFQIMFLGLIGEYIGKQYLDQNKTPQYVVKKVVHHPNQADQGTA